MDSNLISFGEENYGLGKKFPSLKFNILCKFTIVFLVNLTIIKIVKLNCRAGIVMRNTGSCIIWL